MDYPTLYRLPKSIAERAADRLPGIRWKAFLTGDLYANPLHDLADYIQDVTSGDRARQSFVSGRIPIRFTDVAIELEEGGQTSTYFYDHLSQLKIHHQMWNASLSSARRNAGGELRFSHRVSSGKPQLHVIDFIENTRLSTKVCKHLLELRVPFKEFMMGQRVHLGGTAPLSYRDIQKLKEKYGLEW